jgi:hypothetical protein
MQLHIKTEKVIQAPRDKVYQVLADLSSYSEWNPFIIKSKGTFEKGQQIENTMLNGKKTMTFKPIILEADGKSKLEWLGSLWFKGIFDGRHYFHLAELPDGGTNLIHGEYFSGILAKMIYKSIGEQTRMNFVRMNEALKERVERK